MSIPDSQQPDPLSKLIVTGPINRPQRIVVYGPDGIGKTTLAKASPGPVVYIDAEHGSDHQNLERVRVSSYADLNTVFKALLGEQHDYSTIVFDTVDGGEALLKAEVCRKHKVESLEALPYGKGAVYLRELFAEYLSRLDAFIDVHINVVVVAHSQIKKVSLPGLEAYDRYELKLDPQNAFKLKEWSDAVLFLGWDVKTLENEQGKIRGIGGTKRVLYTTHAAAFDAKNRLNLPERLDATPAEFGKIFAGFAELQAQLRELQAQAQPAAPALPASNIRQNSVMKAGTQSQPKERVDKDGLPIKNTPMSGAAAIFSNYRKELAEALSDLDQTHVLAFLVDRQKIKPGQTINDVVDRIDQFRAAIDAFDYIPN